MVQIVGHWATLFARVKAEASERLSATASATVPAIGSRRQWVMERLLAVRRQAAEQDCVKDLPSIADVRFQGSVAFLPRSRVKRKQPHGTPLSVSLCMLIHLGYTCCWHHVSIKSNVRQLISEAQDEGEKSQTAAGCPTLCRKRLPGHSYRFSVIIIAGVVARIPPALANLM